jgi:hypothetical protein
MGQRAGIFPGLAHFFLEIPMPKVKTLHVRLTPQEIVQLDHTCKRLGLTRSDIVRRSLQVALPCFDGIQLPGDAPVDDDDHDQVERVST